MVGTGWLTLLFVPSSLVSLECISSVRISINTIRAEARERELLGRGQGQSFVLRSRVSVRGGVEVCVLEWGCEVVELF